MFFKKSYAIWMIVMTCCVSATLAQGRRGGGGRGGGGGQQGLPPSVYLGARVVEPLQRWEYGRLDIFADPTAKDGIAKIAWHGPGGEKFEAPNMLELVQKILATDITATTAPTEIDDELELWNILGDKGWEYITSETSELPTKTKVTSIRFKRPKR
jgi:hypothetical protein